jgi:hypothetical protein
MTQLGAEHWASILWRNLPREEFVHSFDVRISFSSEFQRWSVIIVDTAQRIIRELCDDSAAVNFASEAASLCSRGYNYIK